jgi:hypothetical protein
MLDVAAEAYMERNPGTRLDTSSDFGVPLGEAPAGSASSASSIAGCICIRGLEGTELDAEARVQGR